jgi:DHA1 family multidrug resistance protein-like MFS transporter
MYGFNLGASSLPFLSVIVALFICVPAYCGYYYYKIEPQVKKSGFGPPEQRLIPGLITFCVPAGLFLFGGLLDQVPIPETCGSLISISPAWTADAKIHWIAPTIGVGLVMVGCYTIMQAIFMYLPFTYPKYAASLFAANDFARSSFAAGCIGKRHFHTNLLFFCLGARSSEVFRDLSCLLILGTRLFNSSARSSVLEHVRTN